MPHESCEVKQSAARVHVGAILVQQGLHSEGMTETMQAWRVNSGR
jgi:hypothetical protein